MGRTNAAAIAAGRAPGDLPVLALVLLVFLAATALQLLYVLPNHDSAWLLVAAERMLDGGTYERDFSELNPPLAILIHAPAILVRTILGLETYNAFIVLMLTYIMVSLVLLRTVVAKGFPPASDLRRWLTPIAALLLLLLPGFDFGQREHLITIFVMPYLALHATKLSRRTQPRGLTVLISAWACLGMFLKPVYLLLPVLIALDRAVRLRSLRSLFSVDMITIGVMGLAYTAVVLIRFPDYFTFAQYAMEFYGVFKNDFIGVALPVVLYVLVGVALALFAARVTDSPEERRMFVLLTLAAGVAATSVILQQKGWSDHMLPISMFVSMSGLMIAVIAGRRIRRESTNRAFTLVARAAPALFAVLLLQSSLWGFDQMSRQDLRQTELYSELEPVAAYKRLYVFTSRVSVGTHWVATIHANWASRFPSLWVLPGYVAAIDSGELSAARREQVAEDIRRSVEEDFERYRPEVVLVDRREYEHGIERPVDFLDFFLVSERFAVIWKSYSFHKAVDGFDIYLLSGQAGAGNSAVAVADIPRST